MSAMGVGVSLRGINHEHFHYPFNLASGTTKDDLGKPVALDASGPNKVKVAGDGDEVIGQLVTVEDRKIEGQLVGTVELFGGWRFDILAADPLAVGDAAVGAAGGKVKKAAAGTGRLRAVEVSGGKAVCIKV